MNTQILSNRFDLTISDTQLYVYINFLCKIEGWKTRCKNLHWAAPKKNIHTYLDEFLDVLSKYQDSLAEDIMGITGQRLNPTCIKGTVCSTNNATDFINQVNTVTLIFFNKIPENPNYAGIKSETENFIHNIKTYMYLFSLCDI